MSAADRHLEAAITASRSHDYATASTHILAAAQAARVLGDRRAGAFEAMAVRLAALSAPVGVVS